MTPVPGFSPAPPYFSIIVRLPVLSLTESPIISMGQDQSWGFQEVKHMLQSWVSILGSPFHLEEPQAREISVGEVSPAWQRGGVGSTQLLLLLF